MTHQPSPAQFERKPAIVLDELLCIRRSQVIDAFARLEAVISHIIIKSDPQFDARVPFGNKLKALGQLSPSNKLSKKAIDRFATLQSEIATLVKIRNDLSHGLMCIVMKDGETMGAFQNAADYANDFPQYTLLSYDDLDTLKRRLLQIANELKQVATPTSPPQPSPAEATGP